MVSLMDFIYELRTTVYSIINSTTGKYCSVALSRMVNLMNFIH